MSVKVGNAASFRLGAVVVAELDSWSLEFGRDLEETHSFGDTWKENTATLGSFSGSGQGRYDPSDTTGHVALTTASLDGTTVACRFYEDATKYFSGTARVKTALSAPTNGVVTVTYSIHGTGALTYV